MSAAVGSCHSKPLSKDAVSVHSWYKEELNAEVYNYFCSPQMSGFNISKTNWQITIMLFILCRIAYPFLVVLVDSTLAKRICSIIRYVYVIIARPGF